MSCLNCKHFDNKCTYEYNCSEKVTLDKAYQQGRADAIEEYNKKIKECCHIVGSCDFEDLDKMAKQLKEK